MIKNFTCAQLIKDIQEIVHSDAHLCPGINHGRAGNLLEDLLGISGGNLDVADAVGFELKTTLSPNTPVTLFHKDPKPRGKRGTPGATAILVDRFGWPSTYKKTGEPVKSFRATIWGDWQSTHTAKRLNIVANNERVSIMHDNEEVAYWDSDDLVGAAAAKLRNIMFVEAKNVENGCIDFVQAYLFEQFQPFKFIKAIENGDIAIDFDARTNPGKMSIRNHGTKFRIKEKDLMLIYGRVTPIEKL